MGVEAPRQKQVDAVDSGDRRNPSSAQDVNVSGQQRVSQGVEQDRSGGLRLPFRRDDWYVVFSVLNLRFF